jgi:hypothetical protein
MLLVSADITTVRITSGDITAVTISNASSNLVVASDITAVTVQQTASSVLSSVPATITVPSFAFATSAPSDIARSSSVGVSLLAAREDHIHSAANLLMDGGNY